MDREKIKKGLQCIIDGTVRCESCGYAIDKHGHHSCQQNCASDAIAVLKEQDDKDINVPIKIIRCKDCKHWTKALGGQCNVLTVNGCAHCTSPDWFCGDGERKEQK